MISFSEYDVILKKTAIDCIGSDKSTYICLENLLNSKDNDVMDLFIFRKYFINEYDEQKMAGYLSLNIYESHSPKDRVTFFSLELDIESLIRRIQVKNVCEKYNSSQILFSTEPRVANHIRIKDGKKTDN